MRSTRAEIFPSRIRRSLMTVSRRVARIRPRAKPQGRTSVSAAWHETSGARPPSQHPSRHRRHWVRGENAGRPPGGCADMSTVGPGRIHVRPRGRPVASLGQSSPPSQTQRRPPSVSGRFASAQPPVHQRSGPCASRQAAGRPSPRRRTLGGPSPPARVITGSRSCSDI